jgi:hypothetical protein
MQMEHFLDRLSDSQALKKVLCLFNGWLDTKCSIIFLLMAYLAMFSVPMVNKSI